MDSVLNLYKNRGETPLQRIGRFKLENPKYANEPMTYAGRLDPMAEGVLLVLCGDEVNSKQKYLDLAKEYEVDILWGLVTDSLDPLGLISETNLEKVPNKDELKVALGSLGKYKQKYPDFSSKTISGVPLWVSKRAGKHVKEVSHEVLIKSFEILNTSISSGRQIYNEVVPIILKVQGDFRQEETIKRWHIFRDSFGDDNFYITKIKVKCSSGTYMRQLAYDLAKKCGLSGAIALRIKRTKVGNYKIENSK